MVHPHPSLSAAQTLTNSTLEDETDSEINSSEMNSQINSKMKPQMNTVSSSSATIADAHLDVHSPATVHFHTHAQSNAAPRRLAVPFAIVVLLSSLVFTALYVGAIPRLVEKFAVQNLKPSEVQVMNFNGVVAAPNAEGMRLIGASPEISRTLTSGEVVFDFTNATRNADAHGYAKASNEWYIKTPILGEEAILITPAIALGIGLGAFSVAFVLLLSFFLPVNIGLMSALTERSIAETRFNLHLQTGLTDDDLDVLCLSDAELILLSKSESLRVERTLEALWNLVVESSTSSGSSNGASGDNAFHPHNLQAHSIPLFRQYCFQRMAETISPDVAAAMQNLRAVQAWQVRKVRFYAALKFFMEESFVPRFGNVVSGLAYSGAAFLIVSVGLRGLRFIPASRPSVLLATISLECVLLICLGITLAFERKEGNGLLPLKRIEHGMNDVARVMQSVDTSVIQRVLQESAAEYARTPEMQQRVFGAIADKALDALRTQPPSKAAQKLAS